jgi:hypothetical protein
MKRFILIFLLSFINLNVFGQSLTDSLINRTISYELKYDNSIILIDSSGEYYRWYPDYSLISNWDISIKLGLIRHIPFNPKIFTGVSTSFGIGLYKPLNNKYVLNFNTNYHHLTNDVGRYFDINSSLLYKLFDLSEVNKRPNTECNVYFTLGGGLGKSEGGYYHTQYGEYNYEMFLGFAVTCKHKNWKLRFDDIIYLPGKLAWNGFDLYKPTRNYFHCWTISVSFNLGLLNEDKLMLQHIIYLLENK